MKGRRGVVVRWKTRRVARALAVEMRLQYQVKVNIKVDLIGSLGLESEAPRPPTMRGSDKSDSGLKFAPPRDLSSSR